MKQILTAILILGLSLALSTTNIFTLAQQTFKPWVDVSGSPIFEPGGINFYDITIEDSRIISTDFTTCSYIITFATTTFPESRETRCELPIAITMISSIETFFEKEQRLIPLLTPICNKFGMQVDFDECEIAEQDIFGLQAYAADRVNGNYLLPIQINDNVRSTQKIDDTYGLPDGLQYRDQANSISLSVYPDYVFFKYEGESSVREGQKRQAWVDYIQGRSDVVPFSNPSLFAPQIDLVKNLIGNNNTRSYYEFAQLPLGHDSLNIISARTNSNNELIFLRQSLDIKTIVSMTDYNSCVSYDAQTLYPQFEDKDYFADLPEIRQQIIDGLSNSSGSVGGSPATVTIGYSNFFSWIYYLTYINLLTTNNTLSINEVINRYRTAMECLLGKIDSTPSYTSSISNRGAAALNFFPVQVTVASSSSSNPSIPFNSSSSTISSSSNSSSSSFSGPQSSQFSASLVRSLNSSSQSRVVPRTGSENLIFTLGTISTVVLSLGILGYKKKI